MLSNVVAGVRSAVHGEDEVVAVFGETQVVLVGAVSSPLEAQRQPSVVVRHLGVAHALRRVLHRRRVSPAREPAMQRHRRRQTPPPVRGAAPRCVSSSIGSCAAIHGVTMA